MPNSRNKFLSLPLFPLFQFIFCLFLLLNLGLHVHMLFLNYGQYRKHGNRSLVSEKGGGSGFYDKPIFAIVFHWEDGGPLRRAEEAVRILFARVLLLYAPDCLNTDNCQWKFVLS